MKGFSNRYIDILKKKGFVEERPTRDSISFFKFPFVVILWFTGKVTSYRVDKKYVWKPNTINTMWTLR